jgi:hypothetical protein
MATEPIEYKDYRLNGFPFEKIGDRRSLTYHEYVEWLADYLHEDDVEVSGKQKHLLKRVEKFDHVMALRSIGTHAGLRRVLAKLCKAQRHGAAIRVAG